MTKHTKKVWYAPYKFESYGQEEIDAVTECLKAGWLGGQGPKSVEFVAFSPVVSFDILLVFALYSQSK